MTRKRESTQRREGWPKMLGGADGLEDGLSLIFGDDGWRGEWGIVAFWEEGVLFVAAGHALDQ